MSEREREMRKKTMLEKIFYRCENSIQGFVNYHGSMYSHFNDNLILDENFGNKESIAFLIIRILFPTPLL